MIDSKVMTLMLHELGSGDEQFKITLERFIKIGLKIAQDSEDMQEELKLYGNMFFHIYIIDIEFNIWIKKIDETLSYNTSFYEKSSENMKTIHFILTKGIMRKIFMQKMDPADAWFKGIIKIEGDLSDAIIARNLLKYFFFILNSFLERK